MRPGERPTVRPVAPAEVDLAAELLVRAFLDDPVASFVFPGGRRRRAGLRSFFRTQIRRQYLPHGHVYTTADRKGVAVWGPPDRPRRPVRELMELLPTAPYLVGPHLVPALRLLGEVDSLHPKEPHWYLATLGTEPARQGTGVGSALLTEALGRVDEEGMPAYLESSKARNVPLYARYGFEVIDELHPRGGGPVMWRMWREPRIPER